MARLHFTIHYLTSWGENLFIDYILPNQQSGTIALVGLVDGEWRGELYLSSSIEQIIYRYKVCKDGNIIKEEPQHCHILNINHRDTLLVHDHWLQEHWENVYQRTAFTECIFRHTIHSNDKFKITKAPYVLQMNSVPPPEGWSWAVVGSSPSLGEWDLKSLKKMIRSDSYNYFTTIDFEDFQQGFEYKYLLINNVFPESLIWENGLNRIIHPQTIHPKSTVAIVDNSPNVFLKPWKGAGVVMPIFSLRSESSFGVGDFGDLLTFVSWASLVGLSLVQILPINDTSTNCPYSACSVFALHPIYLDCREWLSTQTYGNFYQEGLALNKTECLDYKRVLQLKEAFLWSLFEEIGISIINSPTFHEFCHKNDYWLSSYIHYKLKKHVPQSTHFQVGDDRICMYYSFVQFLLHRQLSSVHEQARSRRVILKGDLPIGVTGDSADVMEHPELFCHNLSAGAPPDYFDEKGQNWGFPTYHWPTMKDTNYLWWNKRLEHMGQYFDAYRIDHIFGFFRMWEIPTDQRSPVLGRFNEQLSMDSNEIQQNGFTASIEEYAQPYISSEEFTEWCQLWGKENVNFIIQPLTSQHYTIKKAFRTEKYIYEKIEPESFRKILLNKLVDVLFIEDSLKSGYYYPRILGFQTDMFRRLPHTLQNAYCRLHNDFYYERHQYYWAERAYERLNSIINYQKNNSGMLPCGEDLGMSISTASKVLEKLGILSLEVERMPKEYGNKFGNPSLYKYLSVATTSTHDTTPLRSWWCTNRQSAVDYWQYVLNRNGEPPQHISPQDCETILTSHLKSPSMLCVFPFQDYMSIDDSLRCKNPMNEQINDPSRSNGNWCYRMHFTLEKLLATNVLNMKIYEILRQCGRV